MASLRIIVALFFFSAFILLIVGLIKPKLGIWWGKRKTRPLVLAIYGSVFLITIIIISLISPGNFEIGKQAIEERKWNKAINYLETSEKLIAIS